MKKDKERTVEAILKDGGDIQLVDQMRLMADNQETLDRCNMEDKRIRDLRSRVDEAMMKSKHPDLCDPSDNGSSEEGEVKILLHSPTTTEHHHYPSPKPPVDESQQAKISAMMAPVQQSKSAASLLKKAVIATVLVGSGAGASAAIPWLLGMFDKTPPPVVAPVDHGDAYMDVEKWERPQGSVE